MVAEAEVLCELQLHSFAGLASGFGGGSGSTLIGMVSSSASGPLSLRSDIPAPLIFL